MAEFFKKQRVGAYFNLIAAVLGIVGIVAAVICSNMTVTYSLGNLGSISIIGICGIVLIALAICLPNIFGNHDILSTCSVLGAIALFAAAFANVLSERILLIAGLFSYDSVNTVGWQVFYVTVVAMAAFILADLFLIVGAFNKSVK